VEQLFQFRWWVPDDWLAVVNTLGPPLARAILLALITWYFAGLARASFEHATRRSGADAHLRLLLGRAVFLIVLILGGITVLDALGFPLSTLVTVVGVIGIGVSLALQDILKNFFAGTYLLFERPFRIGDVISVKEQRGVVETIGVRTITLRTAENVQILVPNAMVLTEIVVNRTHERAPDKTPDSPAPVEADLLPPLPAMPLPRPESVARLVRLWKRLPRRLAGLRAWSARSEV
jgi:small conductance mechanosensitive channel